MEEKKNSKKEIKSLRKFTQENIPRCLNCNLICSLKLKYSKSEPTINYQCENGHNGFILLKDYINKCNKFSLSKEKCKECGKTQKELRQRFIYCLTCSKFFCNSCQSIKHTNGDIHSIIDYERYDTLCKIHGNTYVWFCLDCKKNICAFCKYGHESHNLIELPKFNFSESDKKQLEKDINQLELEVNSLDVIKKDFISMIDKLKEISLIEINFIKILIQTYIYEEKLKNLNYYVIENLKVISSNSIKYYEKIFKEGKKCISVLHNIHSNNLTNNYKTLKYHTDVINYLDKLNNGKLVSCSDDKTLKIYKENSFEVLLSIEEHTKRINSFTQLHDERIITCSADQTMKIIKLINEEKYQIDQTLTGHNSDVYKIIEIKENELISISKDKSMKIWKLNNNKKFECITTIIFQNKNSNCNLLKLNEKEFVTSSCQDECLKFWNLNNYSLITYIDNIKTPWPLKTLSLLANDILCVGGGQSKGFYFIKISTHQIVKNIFLPKVVWSINKCMDELLLCSIEDEYGNNCLVKYKFENGNFVKYVEKEKAHENSIYSFVELKDGTIASGGKDKLIKLWCD